MYKNIDWHIELGKYNLFALETCEIHSSVDLLADTATIVLPATSLNKKLEIESKIARGNTVLIQAGYDNKLETEFEGFIDHINTDGGSVTIFCEDSLFLTRKPISDKQFKSTNLPELVAYVASQVGGLTTDCDFNFTYDKFVISKATGYDVLKKLQEETKANIYMKGSVLHVHPAYIEKFGEETYDFSVNIERGNLSYKKANEKKFLVEVEGIAKDGKRVTVKVGTPGGDKRSVKLYGVSSKAALTARGEEEIKRLSYDGYEGSFVGWLIPVVRPGYSCKIIDTEYPEKDGVYYVVAVTTTLSDSGGVRKIQPGKKLS